MLRFHYSIGFGVNTALKKKYMILHLTCLCWIILILFFIHSRREDIVINNFSLQSLSLFRKTSLLHQNINYISPSASPSTFTEVFSTHFLLSLLQDKTYPTTRRVRCTPRTKLCRRGLTPPSVASWERKRALRTSALKTQ